MSMKFKYEAVHTEKYTNKDGEEKKAYTKIGAVFERDDGTMCMKLLDSWVNFYPPKMKEDGYQAAKKAADTGEVDDMSDSIPF
jgi:hypothetical protein